MPRPDTQRTREQQEQQGEVRPGQPTEREKRNVPAPGEQPVSPLTPQTTPQTSPQTGATTSQQDLITQPLALSPEVTRQRVGVREDQVLKLALQDAITLALKNNLDIEASRQGVQIAQYNLFALRGVYDLVAGSEVNYRDQTFPVASIFAGGGEGSAINQKILTYNFTADKFIESTGGSYAVDFANNRTTTNSTAATLTTQYNPTLTFSFVQPVLRNFRTDTNRRQINLAKRQLDLSDSQFRQNVIEIISSVQRAYWDLVFAIRNEVIAREAVELTRVQLQNNQKQVEAGTLAPIELRSTEAALETRKENVIFALQGITTAENTLKSLMLKDANDSMWYSQLTPTDDPLFNQSTFNLEEATALALKNRPELDQMRLQAEQREIDIAFFKNQTKPQLDLIGFYTNTGLAGAPSDIVRDSGGFDSVTLGLVTSLNQARAGLGLSPFVLPPVPPPTTLGASVPDRFSGGYFQSLRNLFGQDFRTWQGGVRISFPFRNRTAEGNLGRALAEARQLDARQRQLVQSIQVEVRNALQVVEATRQRFQAAQAGRIAAEAQLVGEQERFRAGLQTNFFVLQRQNELAVARGSEVRALTDYNKALADLQRVTGMTLVNNNVQVTTALTSNGK